MCTAESRGKSSRNHKYDRDYYSIERYELVYLSFTSNCVTKVVNWIQVKENIECLYWKNYLKKAGKINYTFQFLKVWIWNFLLFRKKSGLKQMGTSLHDHARLSWFLIARIFRTRSAKKIARLCIPPGINKTQPAKYVHQRGVAALSVPVRCARILFMSCTLSLLISPIFVRSAGQNGEAQHVLTRARQGPLGVPRRPFAFAPKINPLLPRTFMHEWQRCRDLM